MAKSHILLIILILIIMKTILKIENVTIEKQGTKLTYLIPSDFDGVKLKKFKKQHEKMIQDFKLTQ